MIRIIIANERSLIPRATHLTSLSRKVVDQRYTIARSIRDQNTISPSFQITDRGAFSIMKIVNAETITPIVIPMMLTTLTHPPVR